ncbi:hypothetical protein ACFQE5_11875 [Pseudonocardia hispaniensis]|uniref:Esterase-like activity of phytase family protein n=1 Tax=Pseudonocardia hispaniensis TaxID=904933 RepID=A0ABW1J249_9PSEU
MGVVLGCVGLVGTVAGLTGGVAAAQLADPEPPQARCTMTDRRLTELSGLAVDGGGVWAMADGGRRVEVYRLDLDDCSIAHTRTAAIDPFDAEDLARGPDGTLWVADTGDNERRRETVALIVLPPNGAPRLHRLFYPDGPHDAEALVVAADGIPLIITKEAVGAAGIYRPAGPLAEPGPTPLLRVGEVVLPRSDTVGGPLGEIGARLVTGAALSADGRVVGLRTYTDAWLYSVTGDTAADLVAALRTHPVRVPLADEPQGEAIAFDLDGRLLSGSESRGAARGEIRVVAGAASLVTSATARSGPVEPHETPAAGVPDDAGSVWSPAATGVVVTAALLVLAIAGMMVHGARRRS